MAIDAKYYFNLLKDYLNTDYYSITPNYVDKEIILKETINASGKTKKIEVPLIFNDDVICIKLDKEKSKGNHIPLFHFLDDDARPWARRCDFVIFNLKGKKIFVYLIEFKYQSFPEKIKDQLDSSLAWCRALHSTVFHYTNYKFTIKVKKFVFSEHPNPNDYLDKTLKYLKRDRTIRHYLYSEVKGKKLTELENDMEEKIR